LSHDSVIVLANLTLLVNGVADCLEIAVSRDNAVNTPALSSVLRPAMEVAGQVAWLFSDNLDGHEHGRRYLIWRFSDLRHQRHVLGEFRPEADEEQVALKELDAEEQELLASRQGEGRRAGRGLWCSSESRHRVGLFGGRHRHPIDCRLESARRWPDAPASRGGHADGWYRLARPSIAGRTPGALMATGPWVF
jgi:hypothetical protein